MGNQGVPDVVKDILDLAPGGIATTSADTSAEAGTVTDPSDDPFLEKCADERETDNGNCRRFLCRHGDSVLFIERNGWAVFDGKCWSLDESSDAAVRRRAQDTADLIYFEALLLDATDDEREAIRDGSIALKERQSSSSGDAAKADKLDARIAAMRAARKAVSGRQSSRYRHAKSSAGTNRINNMLTEARALRSVTVADVDTDHYAVNIESGTLRFVRDENEDSDPDDPTYSPWRVHVDPHRPEDRITKLAPVQWGGDASAPEFDRFLKTIMPDAEIRGFLQRFFGYTLTGSTAEQSLLFFHGVGRNGKSTLVEALRAVMGSYAKPIPIESFTGDGRRDVGAAAPDLARLPGVRLVSTSEPEIGVRLKDASIKLMTGGETMAVRNLNEKYFDLDPQFKIVMQGNHKPRIDDPSDGIWRRMHLVPFSVQIPKEQVDRHLLEKLKMERDGIFAWMVAGAIDYMNNGGLRVPDSIRDATAEYREASDPIGAFVRGGCIVTGDPEDVSFSDDLFLGYRNYAARESLPEFQPATFSRRFPDYSQRSWEGPDGKMHSFHKAKSGRVVWRGIIVKPEFLGQADSSGSAGI